MKQGFSRNKLKYSVNELFFDTWTPQVAYVLGFTFADGNIHRTSLAWDIQRRDRNILQKIKLAMRATYPIKLHRKKSYRLRINNQLLIEGAIRKGLLPKKNIRNELPNIPAVFLRHFVRGYLDGDGWLIIRNGRVEVDLGFSSGNGLFLKDLVNLLQLTVGVTGRVRRKTKVTPRGIQSITYMAEYYSESAYKLAKWMFQDLSSSDLYLRRKYGLYRRVEKIYEFLNSGPKGTKKYRMVQKRIGMPLGDALREMSLSQGLDGVQIAKRLGVHSSSAYRWLARTGVKYPVKRGGQIYG